MLVELRVRDFVVIDEVTTRLGPGLNVLTGETGAGKSILVDALSLLLGERASSDSVRHGAERASVEAVFDVEGREELLARVRERGFEVDDGFLILRREVWREGRNRAWVNGSPAPAGVVGDFGRSLVDLHGQHEHQTLLRPVEQRRILDAFAGSEGLAQRVADLHHQGKALREEIEERRQRQGELEARSDFLRFQLREIGEARLKEGEDGTLEQEARLLEHASDLSTGAESLHQSLYGGEGAISDRVAALRDLARDLAKMDPELGPSQEELEELYHRLVELGRSFGSYASSVEAEPERLEEVHARLDLIARLRRKYGPELDDVLETERTLRTELEELESGDVALEAMEAELKELSAELEAQAEELGRVRRAAATHLEEAMEGMLPALGMEGAVFQVALRPVEPVGPGGGERVNFLVALNPGFDPGPLSKVASGGELSRVMLALKAILSRADWVPTLVFDEIDAGIGGVVAGRVAQRLQEVAQEHQVLVITHLAQIASRAHNHLRVVKEEVEGTTSVLLEGLEGDGRIEEVARLLGGDPESPTSRDHAKELLRGSVSAG